MLKLGVRVLAGHSFDMLSGKYSNTTVIVNDCECENSHRKPFRLGQFWILASQYCLRFYHEFHAKQISHLWFLGFPEQLLQGQLFILGVYVQQAQGEPALMENFRSVFLSANERSTRSDKMWL